MRTALANPAQVESVWKWDTVAERWSFYAPTLQGQALDDYLVLHGYESLNPLLGGEGYWVNAKQGFDALMPAGPTLSTAQVIAKLRSGWSLLSAGEVLTPRQFNDLLTQTTSLPGVVPLKLVSLWAWDSSRANWYFFSPDLDALGSNALADYAASNGYLDFNALGKSLEPNMGFWVRIR